MKISKNGFNWSGEQVGSRKFKIIGQIGCRTVAWSHINGCIDACKSTEIFRKISIQEFLKVENQEELKFCTKIICSKVLHKNEHVKYKPLLRPSGHTKTKKPTENSLKPLKTIWNYLMPPPNATWNHLVISWNHLKPPRK